MFRWDKTNTVSFICFIIFICIFSSCRKKQEEPQPDNLGFFSLGEAKDYILFKQGTNWVYECSLTKEHDSLFLTSCHLDTFHERSKKRSFDYETVDFSIVSLRDKAIYNTHCEGPNPDAIDFQFGWTFECIRNYGFYRDYFSDYNAAIQFYYPFDKEHGRLSLSTASTKFIQRLDSLIVRNKTYYNIVVFDIKSDSSFPYPNINVGNNSSSIYYWAKNTGIIKIEIQGWDLHDNKLFFNWELVDSNIIL